MQTLKESRTVAMESFSIELIEAITSVLKKGVPEIFDNFTRKHPNQNSTLGNRV